MKILAVLLLSAPLCAQTINVNQIRPSTNAGDVITTVAGSPNTTQWKPGGLSPAVPVANWIGPYTTSLNVGVHTLPFAATVPSGCTGSTGFMFDLAGGSAPVAAGSIVVNWMDKTSSTIYCTYTWSASGSVAVVTGSGGTTTPGHTFAFVFPSGTPDETAQNFSFIVNATTPGVSGGSSGGGPTIQTGGVANTSQTLLNFTNFSFNGLSFGWSNPSGGIETLGLTGTLNNAGITNPTITINTVPCTLGGTCTVSGGGGGTPGGSSGQSQYNNAGAFGGYTMSGDASLNTTTGAISISKVNGGSFPASKAFVGTNSSNQIVDASTTFASSSVFGIAKVDGTTLTSAAGVLSATSAISGQAAGVIPLATTATAIGAQSHLDDGVSLASTITSTEPIAVNVAGGQGGTADLTEGTTATAAAGHDVLYADSTSHCIKQSLNGGSFACLGGGTTTNALTMNNGGSGAASGTTFDGSVARTISYNTLGAAPLASPTFTGTPAAPTAAPGTNTTQLATTAFVQAAAGGGGALVLLESHTASASASLAFTAWQSSSYDSYILKVEHLIPTTTNDYFLLRCSINGGSTYDAGSNYSSNQLNYRSAGNSVAGSGDSSTSLELGIISTGIDGTNPLGLTGTLNMTQASSSNYVGFDGTFSMFDGTSDGHYLGENVSGSYKASSATCNALQVIPSGGGHTIASGTVRIYGVVN